MLQGGLQLLVEEAGRVAHVGSQQTLVIGETAQTGLVLASKSGDLCRIFQDIQTSLPTIGDSQRMGSSAEKKRKKRLHRGSRI